jgi:Segment polarity protein dishevelled (Dsh) C terminal
LNILTGSSDSENGGKIDESGEKKSGAAAAVGGRSVDAEGLRTRQLPPPPVDMTQQKRPLPGPQNLQNINPEMNASRQSFRLAMGNQC